MCKDLFSGFNIFEYTASPYMIDLVEEFRFRYPYSRIDLLMGYDQAKNIETWHRHEDLIKLCDFLFMQRGELPKLQLKVDFKFGYNQGLPHKEDWVDVPVRGIYKVLEILPRANEIELIVRRFHEAPPRILIVEDDPTIVDILRCKIRRILKPGSYHLEVATNGEEGYDIAMNFDPQLIITDYDLGDGINGEKLAERLRSSAKCKARIVLNSSDCHVTPPGVFDEVYSKASPDLINNEISLSLVSKGC
jgi:CheY-like chemotaxis protein